MYKTSRVEGEYVNTIQSIHYYSNLEKKLSKEYLKISELVNDKFEKHMLSLMGNNCEKNGQLLQEIIDEFSSQKIIDSHEIELNSWPNISINIYSNKQSNELYDLLRKYSAFEEYLKIEYRGLAEYFTEKDSNRSIFNKFSIIAERHEEYYLVLKNLIKISDVDSMLVNIFG